MPSVAFEAGGGYSGPEGAPETKKEPPSALDLAIVLGYIPGFLPDELPPPRVCRLSVELARCPECPEEVLWWMAGQPQSVLGMLVAANEATPPALLKQLYETEQQADMWIVIASHPACPDDVLWKMAEDPFDEPYRAASRRRLGLI